MYSTPKGRGGFYRRENRIIDFTEESIANLPVSTSNCDHWYDRAMPNLMAMRTKAGAPVTFRYRLASHERRALGLGTTSYVTLGRLTLEQAKAKGVELEERIQKALKNYVPPPRKKRGAGKVKEAVYRDPDAVVEDLMAERPPEENAHYESLMTVLMDAYAQATNGKGSERHAGGTVSFEKQDMIKIAEATSTDFPIGQALKKLLEGRRMEDKARQRAELLGAIVYVAGAIVCLDREEG